MISETSEAPIVGKIPAQKNARRCCKSFGSSVVEARDELADENRGSTDFVLFAWRAD